MTAAVQVFKENARRALNSNAKPPARAGPPTRSAPTTRRPAPRLLDGAFANEREKLHADCNAALAALQQTLTGWLRTATPSIEHGRDLDSRRRPVAPHRAAGGLARGDRGVSRLRVLRGGLKVSGLERRKPGPGGLARAVGTPTTPERALRGSLRVSQPARGRCAHPRVRPRPTTTCAARRTTRKASTEDRLGHPGAPRKPRSLKTVLDRKGTHPLGRQQGRREDRITKVWTAKPCASADRLISHTAPHTIRE